ncbi:MAG: hypothetical protein J0H98_10600 [Solirubrobacterales bacterium]|nr:hypothetical protein [Solirubrobacterales bacterium]
MTRATVTAGALALALLATAVAAPPSLPTGPAKAEARYQKTMPVGWGPRSSKAAARLVKRARWEPRPGNRKANHRIPPKRMLKAWRKRSDMPYKRFVNGRFKGTTDEIIQWASLKWGIDTDTMRAVAAVESWWDMKTLGDNGDSFGLYQVRRPYHCWGKCQIARYYTAFNADYYGGIIRSYYDGTQKWLNTVEGNGKPYRAGDLQGSMGAWYSGRWWGPPERPIEPYLEAIEQRRSERIWKHPDFIAYGRG